MINWDHFLVIPDGAHLDVLAKDLIARLLTSADRRLGAGGAKEIKSHPFFQPVSFDNLRQQTALYRPELHSAHDTSNFDSIDEDQLRSNRSHETDDGQIYPMHGFYDFTFKRFFEDAGVPGNLPSNLQQYNSRSNAQFV